MKINKKSLAFVEPNPPMQSRGIITGLSDNIFIKGTIMTKHYAPVIYCCLLCGKEEHTSSFSQHLHYHHQHLYPKKPTIFGNCLYCAKEMRGYEKNPEKKFCDRSCAAKYNNVRRSSDIKCGPTSKYPHLTQKERVAKNKWDKHWMRNISGPYSPLIYSHCAICNKLNLTRKYQKYCDEHSDNYSHKQRAKYWFSFYLGDYPSIFDFSLLKQYGMRTNKNQSGVVRDHKVSVADAIKNNYDPYYIKHPLNCELMLHSDNSKKYTNSSITYNELVKMVDEWDMKNKSQEE